MTLVPLLATCLERLSAVCSLFLRRGGTIVCELTGSRRASVDLPLIEGHAALLLADRRDCGRWYVFSKCSLGVWQFLNLAHFAKVAE